MRAFFYTLISWYRNLIASPRAGFIPPHNKLCVGFIPLEVRRQRWLPFRHWRNGLLTGLTLLETVVAVTLLFVATMGPLTLMTKSLSDFYASQNKLVALHLAQEGIELVRVVREHNAICDFLEPGWPWRSDSDGTGLILGSNLKADATEWTDTFTCGEVTEVTYNNPNFSGGCSDPILMDSNGHYGYVSGTPTIFNRCINVTTTGGPEDGISTPDMMDVVSTVTWAERRGPTRAITLQTRLYHWK